MLLVLPYKKGSKSAKALADSLGVLRIKLDNLNVNRFARNDIHIINWGNSTYPRVPNAKYFNDPDAVEVASNKLKAFQKLDGQVQIPDFTTDINVAEQWDGPVVERYKLTGHSAEGLVIKQDNEGLGHAPLYVRYLKKTDEYRVHVFRGTVFHVQRKARKADVPDDQVNWQVRNLANGFIYQLHIGKEVPKSVLTTASKAVEVLGLDFGAVDVIYHNDTGATVLEVNTACGLEGTTLDKYQEIFSAALQGHEIPEWVQPPRVPEDLPVEEQPEPLEEVERDDPDPEPEELLVHINEFEIEEVNEKGGPWLRDLQALVDELDDIPVEFIRDNWELIKELVVKLNTGVLK